ncbi:MAG: SDR family NAD(P)-dependent oxidoreductase [Candidatus Moraniibacteriota bacterium]
MKNVLVTGGSGFIGSHLVEHLLKRGFNVTIFDIEESKFGLYRDIVFIKGDITDRKKVQEIFEKKDVVFHLAGLLGTHELVQRAHEAVRVNIGGAISVLDACSNSQAKLIYVSKPDYWLNPYTITKIASENFVQMYRVEFGVEAVIVRWFNVYGSRQPLFEIKGYRKAIPTWIVNGLKGAPIEIYGSGNQTMDLIHTEDTVQATTSILDNWGVCEGRTLEIGTGIEVSVNDAALLIRELTGLKSEIVHVPMRPGETEDTRIRADNSLISHLTGWKPRISLREGLSLTVEWYSKNSL